MQKEMEAGSWRGKAKDGSQAARVTPNVLAQYREDTMRTTGRLLLDDRVSPYFVSLWFGGQAHAKAF